MFHVPMRLAVPALLLLAVATPAKALADEIVVAKRSGGAERKHAIEDFWTKSRIARARPIELVRGRDGELDVRRAEQRRNHPAPFESGRVAEPTAPENAVNGKLLGKMRDFGSYECSATAVDAANRNLIMTAGHCVAAPSSRKLAKKLAFIPAFEEGRRPFGTWVFDRIVVLRSWRRNSNFNFDFAAVEMSPRSGLRLQDAVGGAPIATKLPARQAYYAVGYPANLGNGRVMRYCSSRFQGYDPHPIPNGPTAISMGCDMGVGASGGGWFVNGHLNSVTSFGYEDHPDVSYGPYFGGKAAKVYAKGAR